MGIDFYAFSGHKVYGPTGIGVLWGRQALLEDLPPFMGGGGMVKRLHLGRREYAQGHQRFEAGTPPIAQAVGLGEALEWLMELPWDGLHEREHRLSARLLEVLKAMPGLRVLGPQNLDQRLPLFSFDIEGMHPHDICHLMDQQGVALRGGHHCAQPLMERFGVSASTRVSLALFNDEDDISALSEALKTTMEKLL
jgi:cysteine desulfurase/selenocysteine lyase